MEFFFGGWGAVFDFFWQMYLTAENKKSTRSDCLWKWARNISSKAFDPGWKEEGYKSIDRRVQRYCNW